jgi:hypothetical protein
MKQETKCQICKLEFDDSELYEYRGFIFCQAHFDEGIKKVDHKRQEVMEVTEKSVKSQRVGEFVNNRSKYHLGNVAGDGLPIIKLKEPQILKEYEQGIL